MFEFNAYADCPFCDHYQQVLACFDSGMSPIKTTAECEECDKQFIVSPYEVEVDVSTEKPKKK